jgi:hypothetical protein
MSEPGSRDAPLSTTVPQREMTIAEQIIDGFLVSLSQTDGYGEIARNLRTVVVGRKPTEASLRSAMFGDVDL